MTHITKLRVENVLGAKEIEFSPNGQSVTIGGKNGQGKSSAIWALAMALGGKTHVPAEPVTQGAEEGSVVVETDQFRVKWKVGSDRKTSLVVESADGAKFASPQTLLNKCFSNLSFDPGAFRTMDRKTRVATLAELVGVDFTPFNEQRKKLYDKRHEVGIELKSIEGKLDGASIEENLDAEPVSVADLLSELKSAQDHNAKIQELERDSAETYRRIGDIESENKRLIEKVAQIQAEIARNEELRFSLINKAAKLAEQIQKPIDEAPIRERIETADRVNKQIEKNREVLQLRNSRDALAKDREDLSRMISEVDREKVELVSKAKFPVDGLSVTEDDVLFNGIPFEQISESQQWEISTAIGFALNPKGVLFLRNSGGLDSESRQRIRERAEKLEVQLFLEVVDDQADVQILIEEGRIKDNRLQELAA